jgi:tRNA A37 threonylcarbamoyladenosine biosynthesis protein TsaE
MIRPLATFGARLVRSFACATTLSLNACSLSVSNDICKVIASHLKGGDVVQLIGKVGAGKTATARCIIRALVKNDDEVVQSPTFSLALSYQCTFPLELDRVQVSHFLFACFCSNLRFVHHIDAYRQAAARSTRLVSRAHLHLIDYAGWSRPAPF